VEISAKSVFSVLSVFRIPRKGWIPRLPLRPSVRVRTDATDLQSAARRITELNQPLFRDWTELAAAFGREAAVSSPSERRVVAGHSLAPASRAVAPM